MIKHPFNGSVEGKKGQTRALHYEGVAMIVENKQTQRFHTSYSIHLHDGHGVRLGEDKHVTVVGEFATEHDAMHAALEHSGKYFR